MPSQATPASGTPPGIQSSSNSHSHWANCKAQIAHQPDDIEFPKWFNSPRAVDRSIVTRTFGHHLIGQDTPPSPAE
ncbi:hypothetical protein M407DRAFT_98286 [Tulasnella calospora MUT 4182]|uniref:Uncharacterized protein n=1 Tax=Tulasnella calospora MUT 4182 TaxID=1051891 RepID=A0A0C3QGU8_9AGAM|nr:hypothetical protein M407DRAFT_98286 [Tulasnella calospora MUT 4182]